MIKINQGFLNIKDSYLFTRVGRLIAAYKEAHPSADIIKMGIGDVTLPVVPAVVDALVAASLEQGDATTFSGYGPEQGHRFLIDAIIEGDYRTRGVELSHDEVFISDGAKSDIGNIGDILAVDNTVGVTDPVYPVYLDTNIMAGRRVKLFPCTRETGFLPELPQAMPDIMYLCYPNNPTGASMTRSDLKQWVDRARSQGTLLLFDSAYEAYIQRSDVPHSIYEIEGARECAVEFRSFSKTAGFTGLRLGYTVVPKELAVDAGGRRVLLNDLWRRRQCTKFNGASYIVQRGGAAIYTPGGRSQVNANIAVYMNNARVMLEGLAKAGLEATGGVDAPYVWVKTPAGCDSWQFFDLLLDRCNVAGTPGEGFGPSGEGYLRLTAFNTPEATREAMRRLARL